MKLITLKHDYRICYKAGADVMTDDAQADTLVKLGVAEYHIVHSAQKKDAGSAVETKQNAQKKPSRRTVKK